MPHKWNLHRFDYRAFEDLEYKLIRTMLPDEFIELLPDAEGEAVAKALGQGRLKVCQARNVILMRRCCMIDPVPIDMSFYRTFVRQARQLGVEDGAELLERLVGSGGAVSTWYADPLGIWGWLTPDETRLLHGTCQSLLGGRKGSSRGQIGTESTKVRRTDLMACCGRFWRNLVLAKPTFGDTLLTMEEYLRRTVKSRDGVAITPA